MKHVKCFSDLDKIHSAAAIPDVKEQSIMLLFLLN